jgi:nitrate/nitrite transport system substrate-binding protein
LKVLYERVQKGDLDGAHMLAAMPLASMTTTSDVQIISHLPCPTMAQV